jgi:hypothetical protein
MDIVSLHTEVAWTCEAIAAAEAARATAVLAFDAFAQEAAAVQDDATLRINDVEDRAALEAREVLHWVSQVEAENSTALTSTRSNVEGLAQKIALLESELTEDCQDRETSEREYWECFDELTLLQTQGSEMYLTIIGPPRPRRLYEGKQLATLHHNKMVQELAMFWMAVSSAVESVLECSPNNVARAEVVGELVAKLHRVEGHHWKLEWPTTKICDLLLGPPPSRAWLADHLEEVPGRLRVELDARQEVEAKSEAL